MQSLGDRFALPTLGVLSVLPHSTTGGGSGAFLALLSDSQPYFVKPRNNPQGDHTLVAEVVAFGLGQSIGAPVCEGVLVEIPSSMNFEYVPGRRPSPGIGWGSRVIESALVSDTWSEFRSKDSNRKRQASLVALWDLCMGGDPQWLHAVSSEYSIWSFDHGLWLANEGSWNLAQLRASVNRGWDDLDPRGLDAQELRSVASRLDALPREQFQAVCHAVPLEWGVTADELSELANILYLRSQGVVARLMTAATQADNTGR
ncbi:hypothetical protein [Leifsonia naganoensis]|nr:hypothetical protein [Leifsonia naganoensis]